jgi:hypothetical protein
MGPSSSSRSVPGKSISRRARSSCMSTTTVSAAGRVWSGAGRGGQLGLSGAYSPTAARPAPDPAARRAGAPPSAPLGRGGGAPLVQSLPAAAHSLGEAGHQLSWLRPTRGLSHHLPQTPPSLFTFRIGCYLLHIHRRRARPSEILTGAVIGYALIRSQPVVSQQRVVIRAGMSHRWRAASVGQ